MDQILRDLRDAGLVGAGSVEVEPLNGGVSSSIHVVRHDGGALVVKHALERLKVADEWRADVSRNDFEQKYMRYVTRLLPGAVPAILHSNPRLGYFAMEYLSGSWRTWKSELLEGRFNPETAAAAGRLLGTVHESAHQDRDAARTFASDANFHQLRIDPYLLATGQRHPDLREKFRDEAVRLAATKETLVHGDFSPKNMLIDGERLVLLDCEVAWFGDPAFDVAFLLNHLFLKELHVAARPGRPPDLVAAFLAAYGQAYAKADRPLLEARVAVLLPMLLLARVDGKSPVEYLGDKEKEFVRRFATDFIRRPASAIQNLHDEWRTALGKECHAN